jgi:hypothetical protein
VIQSFGSQDTEELFHYQHSRRFRAIERVALRKLLQLHAATELRVLASRLAIVWKHCIAAVKVSTRSALMISGAFASPGAVATAITWKFLIITEGICR